MVSALVEIIGEDVALYREPWLNRCRDHAFLHYVQWYEKVKARIFFLGMFLTPQRDKEIIMLKLKVIQFADL